MGKVEDAATTMINNLPEKTGRSLSQWYGVLKKAGFQPSSKHGDLMKLLKSEFSVTHGFANLIAISFRESESTQSVDLISSQYSGKEALKPLYDKLMVAVAKFGKDIEIAPKKAYVSLRRSKQFAIVQPSTKTRLDVGINLKGEKAIGRLENAGSFNAMVSHRVKLSDLKDVDAELIAWLKKAYQAS